MNIERFYDAKRGCWAIKFGDEIEYFNHETPAHDKKNADACFNLLVKQILALTK